MRFASRLNSPLGRGAFLVFAIIATVATSPPAWSVSASPAPVEERLTLAPGSLADRRISYSASQVVHFSTQLEGSPPLGAKIRIVQDDEGNGSFDLDAGASQDPPIPPNPTGPPSICDQEDTFEATEDGKWDFTKKQQAVIFCAARGTLRIRVINEGSSEVAFVLSVKASIAGEGDDDPPKGAFVRASVVP